MSTLRTDGTQDTTRRHTCSRPSVRSKSSTSESKGDHRLLSFRVERSRMPSWPRVYFRPFLKFPGRYRSHVLRRDNLGICRGGWPCSGAMICLDGFHSSLVEVHWRWVTTVKIGQVDNEEVNLVDKNCLLKFQHKLRKGVILLNL